MKKILAAMLAAMAGASRAFYVVHAHAWDAATADRLFETMRDFTGKGGKI